MHEVIEDQREKQRERKKDERKRQSKAGRKIGEREQRTEEKLGKRRARGEARAATMSASPSGEVGDRRHKRARRKWRSACITGRATGEETFAGVETHNEYADKTRDDCTERKKGDDYGKNYWQAVLNPSAADSDFALPVLSTHQYILPPMPFSRRAWTAYAVAGVLGPLLQAIPEPPFAEPTAVIARAIVASATKREPATAVQEPVAAAVP